MPAYNYLNKPIAFHKKAYDGISIIKHSYDFSNDRTNDFDSL